MTAADCGVPSIIRTIAVRECARLLQPTAARIDPPATRRYSTVTLLARFLG
jgi:hypothetical protein